MYFDGIFFKWDSISHYSSLCHSVEKQENLSHKIFFREINYLVNSLIKSLLSRNSWQKSAVWERISRFSTLCVLYFDFWKYRFFVKLNRKRILIFAVDIISVEEIVNHFLMKVFYVSMQHCSPFYDEKYYVMIAKEHFLIFMIALCENIYLVNTHNAT